jgi:hypothetical protein
MSNCGLPKSHALYREARRLNEFLGPLDDPFEGSENTKAKPTAKCSLDSYADDEAFLEFVDREFENTAGYSTLEEMVEFAFGDIDSAIEAYEEHKSAMNGDTSTEESDETT